MFRAVIPIMKKSTAAIGEELMRSGANVVRDVWRTGDLRGSQKKRGKEFIANISNRVSDHMFGGGYPRVPIARRKQLKSGGKRKKTRKVVKRGAKKGKKAKKTVKPKKKKTVKKKKTTRTKQNIQDIFT